MIYAGDNAHGNYRHALLLDIFLVLYCRIIIPKSISFTLLLHYYCLGIHLLTKDIKLEIFDLMYLSQNIFYFFMRVITLCGIPNRCSEQGVYTYILPYFYPGA